jgi:aminopeptidase YwaD
LGGALTREQLMPKNFPFYKPDEHMGLIGLLERKRPAAIVAATARDEAMAGALYPFPLIEDGDFDIPSAYMTDEQGAKLAGQAGREASLEIRAKRTPAHGANVIARNGGAGRRRVVLMAHIDAKEGTPGALDNAGGVAILLLAAEQLSGYLGDLGIEFVAMNGEDYYSNPGEQEYLRRNEGRLGGVLLGINVDGVGYLRGKTAYSLYDCPVALADRVRRTFAPREEMCEGEPWYQGDHSLFVMNQRPALALTSERAPALMAEVIHSPMDSPKIVDVDKLVAAALALRDLLARIR